MHYPGDTSPGWDFTGKFYTIFVLKCSQKGMIYRITSLFPNLFNRLPEMFYQERDIYGSGNAQASFVIPGRIIDR
jgi:hypothetical protein